jgi:hypothetical protein
MSAEFEAALKKVRPLTMVARESLEELSLQVRAVIASGMQGAVVECGVWCGGTSFLMAELLKNAGDNRKVWLFDSFEGMPKPEKIDGPAAAAWEKDKYKPWYGDNIPYPLEDVKKNAERLGLADRTEMVKGWFNNTLMPNRDRIGPIALLRIDADWHSSVTCCLESLYDQVVPGGFVVLDDYYAFDGCAVAVHEFMGKRHLPYRIETGTTGALNPEFNQFACFRKGLETWKATKASLLLGDDLRSLNCDPRKIILIDDEQQRDSLGKGFRPLPFTEHEGKYWGAPADDATAIRELARMQAAGAEYAAVAWPGFWWLDYYKDFARHLRERHTKVLENQRVVIFRLNAGS